ncbi:DUF3298 and DUF4163 domain-containing protein [Algoriphagus namhaensis]
MKKILLILPVFILVACQTKVGSSRTAATVVEKKFEKKACVEDDCAEVSLQWVELLGDSYAASVNSSIVEKITRYLVYEDTVLSMQEAAQFFLDGFTEAKEEFPDSPGGWYVSVNAATSLDSLGIFSVKFEEESYTGGAHGSYSTTFLNFSKKDGSVLANEQIIQNKPKLLALAEAAFREKRDIHPDSSLLKAGYWVDQGFFLPAAMGLSPQGLILYYNSYEIAPYSEGPTELVLTFDELGDILALPQ